MLILVSPFSAAVEKMQQGCGPSLTGWLRLIPPLDICLKWHGLPSECLVTTKTDLCVASMPAGNAPKHTGGGSFRPGGAHRLHGGASGCKGMHGAHGDV